MIIRRKPPQAAARARRQAGRKARRQHYRPQAKQLEAADYLMLMTRLPGEAMAARQAIALDRLRWQIELAFKRLKSLIGLADLAAKEARLAKAALYAKLILAVLADSLVGHVLARSPQPSPALRRLTRLVLEHLKAAVLSFPPIRQLLDRLAATRRNLAEPSRRRPRQLLSLPCYPTSNPFCFAEAANDGGLGFPLLRLLRPTCGP